MKIRLIIVLTLIWTTTSFGQSSREGLIGVYKSNANSFERYSVMTLETNNRFIYKYGLGGCQGEVKGTWKIVSKKILFENDPSFLNDSIVHYPNLALIAWTVKTIGIRPEGTVDSGCLKEDNPHLKEGVISASKISDKEDFSAFFEKFTTDSLCQIQRIKFPFRVLWTTEDGETVHETAQDDWTHSTFYYEDGYATREVDAYTQEVRNYGDTVKLVQRGVDNGIHVDYEFALDKGKWILVSGKDYSH